MLLRPPLPRNFQQPYFHRVGVDHISWNSTVKLNYTVWHLTIENFPWTQNKNHLLKISDCVINTFGHHYFLSDDLSLSKKLKELGDPVRILKYVQLYMISIADAVCDPDLFTCHNIFFTKFEKENFNKKLSIVLPHISVLYLEFGSKSQQATENSFINTILLFNKVKQQC